LLVHPKVGASWEGYAVDELLKSLPVDEAYFWATHGGAELDLLIIRNGEKFGVECKRVDAPHLTPSMKMSLEDLQLEKLTIIYPGNLSYQLADRVSVMPLSALADDRAMSIVSG
jgi:predicted AAA+ superfamily ATPase